MSKKQDDSESQADAPDDAVSNATFAFRTCMWVLVILVVAHLAVGYLVNEPAEQIARILPWRSILGLALAAVAVLSFGGFLRATARIRVAIAAAFVLTFLALLSFYVAVPQIGAQFGDGVGKDFAALLTSVVSTVVAFYFGTEAVVSGLKVWQVAKAEAEPGTDDDDTTLGAESSPEPDGGAPQPTSTRARVRAIHQADADF